ncbi:putative peripheral membrane protein [Heliocybe sulcata]|uniref:Autophagy-related protein 11 n=1 Tax=Heliocybe sulcata TaxID=5364 RepID=A0A5C3MZD8_9AGAM|nr:putative peripheral membrane protein [Heliocybe sulcata]
MLQICRAEDGEAAQVNVTLSDIERIGSLELFLHQETGVDEEAILAYLSDGKRLRNDNIRELAGAQDQTIYVFNKYYLDVDLEEVLQELKVDPPLQPPLDETISATPPFRPSQFAASSVRIAQAHRDHVTHILSTLQYQHEALRIASDSLDLNVLALAEAFDSIAMAARKELEKQASLLSGLDADLDMISRVNVHAEFLSPAVRKAIESGDRGRTLGDYVSNVKMRQVAETCRRTHSELYSRFEQAEGAMARLQEGADEVRAPVADRSLLDSAESAARIAQDAFDKIADAAAALESPASNPERLIQELRQLDARLREQVVVVTDIKNTHTATCIRALRRISTLNNDVVQLPTALTSLQASFRVKTSFSHIQRLHNMIYAYGATMVEIVRRKEFARFFFLRAQTILEVMAKFSANERKQRQIYKGEIQGQLPFDIRGLDDPVPQIDFSRSGNTDSQFTFERSDIEDFLKILDELDQVAHASADLVALATIREARLALEKAIAKIDGLESGFDRIAERSLLSSSRLSLSRRRASEVDEQMYSDLAQQLESVQLSKDEQERSFEDERSAYRAEIDRLKAALQDADVTADRADRMERDLHQARAQAESDVTARRVLEERHSELLADVEQQRQALTNALAEATEQTRTAEILRQELAKMQDEYQDVKVLEARHAAKISKLMEDQSTTLRNLEEARNRGEDLHSQIQAARNESEEVRLALEQADKEKDRLLKVQASEHDRIMRDCIAEADGDRAVLEHQFSELKAALEDTERQLKEAWSRNEMTNADAMGLREELQRVEHQLREARHAEALLREDLKAGITSQSDYEHRLEEANRLVAQILDVAIAFRNSHVRAISTAQAVLSHPRFSGNQGDLSLSQSVRPNINGHADEPSPIDPSDPATALEQLREFDHDHFLEIISKTGSTIRKWQKQCKEYRERAKGKISFRNFAKGDLALFLPTRNSVSKPWAAFNVSFPHYFLNATGHLAEQLKSREWIVARITSITERVVDHRDSQDPSSNPYGLGDGVKYYTLEVEDWTQPSPPSKKKLSAKKAEPASGEAESPPRGEPSAPLPVAEVEESFEATRPPNSHLFPTRSRTQSSPTAGPSSLSRLLAQAPVDAGRLEPIPGSESPSSPLAGPSPSPSHARARTPTGQSPLRSASRSSRVSISSRFSGGRIPPLGSASSGQSMAGKAAPTTALSGHAVPSSPGAIEDDATSSRSRESVVPSPEGSPSDGMSSVLAYRRRTSSYHVPRTSPLSTTTTADSLGRTANGAGGGSATSTLATLASSWGMSFGRRKKAEVSSALARVASSGESADNSSRRHSMAGESSASASELLKRL